MYNAWHKLSMVLIPIIHWEFYHITEMLKAARGNLNQAHFIRCARMSGAFGQHMDKIFTSPGLGKLNTRCRCRGTNVVNFVNDFYDDSLLDYVPGRRHSACPTFVQQRGIVDAPALGRQLKNLAHAMNRWRRLVSIRNDWECKLIIRGGGRGGGGGGGQPHSLTGVSAAKFINDRFDANKLWGN